MKYCRFLLDDQPYYGTVQDRPGITGSPEPWIVELQSAPDDDHEFRRYHSRSNPISFSSERGPLSAADLLAPVTPSKIICVGRNYRDHAQELGNEVPAEPLLFFKPSSSLLAPGGTIRLPKLSHRVDFEGELAVVIGKRAKKLHRDQDLRPYIHGYTLANDVTARDLQKKDAQWTRAKGFDTFCPAGPIVDTSLDLADG